MHKTKSRPFLKILMLALFSAVMVGCSQSASDADAPAAEPTPPSTPPQKSSLDTAIEGATGKAAIEAGRATKTKIDKISAGREDDIKELDSF